MKPNCLVFCIQFLKEGVLIRNALRQGQDDQSAYILVRELLPGYTLLTEKLQDFNNCKFHVTPTNIEILCSKFDAAQRLISLELVENPDDLSTCFIRYIPDSSQNGQNVIKHCINIDNHWYVCNDRIIHLLERNLNVVRTGYTKRTLKTPQTDFLCGISQEFTICIHCSTWPSICFEWVQRKRKSDCLSKELIHYLVRLGCSVSPPKGSTHNKRKFEINFALQEQTLVSRFTGVQYQLMWIISGHFTTPDGHLSLISPYVTQTCLFWVQEENPPDIWTDENLSACGSIVTEWLVKAVQANFCPHYFIKKKNIFHRLLDLEDKEIVIKEFKSIQQICRLLTHANDPDNRCLYDVREVRKVLQRELHLTASYIFETFHDLLHCRISEEKWNRIGELLRNSTKQKNKDTRLYHLLCFYGCVATTGRVYSSRAPIVTFVFFESPCSLQLDIFTQFCHVLSIVIFVLWMTGSYFFNILSSGTASWP